MSLAKFGEVVRLNGAIPHGTDLRHAQPRRCRGCAGLFLVFGKGSARAAYCAECRAKKCPCCNGAGGHHYPYCSSLKPRPCRGCGVELGHGGSQRLFCGPCWENQCPECGVRGGRHQRICRYDQRRRRPGLTTVYNVVTQEEIAALYLAHRARAVRLAGRICGPAHAEDVVHDVTLFLLAKRAHLKDTPGRRYFLKAVKHAALRRLLYAWERTTVAMDPDDLVLAEQATYDRTGAAMAVPV
jgi:hypothetical protein